MKKMLTLVLIGMICLAPALVAAQTGGAAGSGSSSGAAGSTSGGSSTGGTGSTGATSSGSGSSSGSPSSSGGASSGTSPSASPTTGSFSSIHNQADCEKAGGDWQASTNLCQPKK